MEVYTLVNRFREIFRTGGYQRMRSKKVQFLEEENFLFKKKESHEGI
jgi:hypothetical protein